MPLAPDEPKEVLKTKKIRIFPTLKQKAKYEEWFGTARWTYNRCIDFYKNKAAMMPPGVSPSVSKTELREFCVNNDADATHGHEYWLFRTPSTIRSDVVGDFCSAIKGNHTKQKKGTLKTFEMHYRTKKTDQEIPLRRQEWKRKRGMYAGFIGPSAQWKTCHRNRQRKDVIPEDLEHDVRLLKTRMGQYFLCIPIELKRQPPPSHRIIALDPGVRTFLTAYDPHGVVSEWGSGDAQRLFRLCFGLDKLISKTNQATLSDEESSAAPPSEDSAPR
jgi:putative transposase